MSNFSLNLTVSKLLSQHRGDRYQVVYLQRNLLEAPREWYKSDVFSSLLQTFLVLNICDKFG